MKSKRWFLVSYDVRDPKRLRRTAKLLSGYGMRVQYSLFRCFLNNREVERLRWELSLILAAEDDLVIVGLCRTCARKLSERHEDLLPKEEEVFQIV